MRIALFCHSLISCWNHGNAHFLRGVVRELGARGHEVRVFEPAAGWSLQNLLAERPGAIEEFRAAFPGLDSTPYDPATLDLERALDAVDLVIAHEWIAAEVLRELVAWRSRHPEARLLFHDTHHRAVTDPASLPLAGIGGCDGVLAFGGVLRDLYLARGWAARAWTWHEAADTRVFRPLEREREGDLVWIGNWGDEERTAELTEFLLGPVGELGLRARVHGVRYPEWARAELARVGIEYRGWVPNHLVPEVFARFALTVHVPRRPYTRALPGIPTIRVFEALACGIPLVTAPWEDREGLFTPGEDFLVARSGREMTARIRDLLADPGGAEGIAAHGRETVLARHTCGHRADELIAIAAELGLGRETRERPRATAPAAVVSERRGVDARA